MLPDDPELRLGLEKLRLFPEDDLLLLTLDPDEPLPEDLLDLLDERTFLDCLEEDLFFLFPFVTRRFEVEVLGFLNDF